MFRYIMSKESCSIPKEINLRNKIENEQDNLIKESMKGINNETTNILQEMKVIMKEYNNNLNKIKKEEEINNKLFEENISKLKNVSLKDEEEIIQLINNIDIKNIDDILSFDKLKLQENIDKSIINLYENSEMNKNNIIKNIKYNNTFE